MSGHSKWANIKRKKAVVDDVRGRVFTKISKEIFVAVKQGGPDPDGNFRLKLCIQKAKANNMPADNIKRCIQKAAGMEGTDAYEEISYEGYGPAGGGGGGGGVAVLCSILTDNRNRTASEVRYIFSRNNGNLGESGCVSWMFGRKGQILVSMEDKDEDELMMLALDLGAEDFSSEEEEAEIVTSPENLEGVQQKLIDAGYEVNSAEITMLPENTVEITDAKTAGQILKLIDALEDNEDIQAVYSNFDIPDEIMAQLEE